MFQDLDTLWLEYHQNITDQSLLCVDTYLAQFPEIKVSPTLRFSPIADYGTYHPQETREHLNQNLTLQ